MLLLAGAVTPEIVTVTMDSGVFCCSSGSSNVYTGLLSREDVLNCSLTQPYTRHDAERLIGGSISDKISSAIGHVLHKKGHHKHHKEHHDIVGGSLGSAVSGGNIMASHHHHKLHKHVRK